MSKWSRRSTFIALALLAAIGCRDGVGANGPDGGIADPADSGMFDAQPGDAGADGPIAIPPGSTITGTVVDARGLPQAQVTVTLTGALVITGADGKFSVPAPAAFPYDLLLSGRYDTSSVLPAQMAPRRVGVLFSGVDRLDPTLMLPFGVTAATGTRSEALIKGGYAGLGRPADTTGGIVISPMGIGNVGPTFYTFVPFWTPSSPADTSRMTAVRLALWKGTGEALTVLASGKSAEQTFTNGQTVNGADIVTTAATGSPLTASVTAGSVFTHLQALVTIGVGDFTFTPWEVNKPLAGATPISMPVPTLDDASFDLGLTARISADDLNGRRVRLMARKLAPGTALASLVLPDPPALVEPADAATVPLSGTTFRISQVDPHLRVHAFDFDDVGLFVVTAADQLAFPDLSAVSIAAPTSGTTVGWRVTSYTEPSVSAALGASGYTGARADRASIPAGEIRVEGSSERRTFVVQ